MTQMERELAALKAGSAPEDGVPWWKQIAADVKHPEVYAEIARLGAEIRAQDRGVEH